MYNSIKKNWNTLRSYNIFCFWIFLFPFWLLLNETKRPFCVGGIGIVVVCCEDSCRCCCRLTYMINIPGRGRGFVWQRSAGQYSWQSPLPLCSSICMKPFCNKTTAHDKALCVCLRVWFAPLMMTSCRTGTRLYNHWLSHQTQFFLQMMSFKINCKTVMSSLGTKTIRLGGGKWDWVEAIVLKSEVSGALWL